MRLSLLAALLSAAITTASAQEYRVRVTLPGWDRVPLALDTVATPVEIDAPAHKVFLATVAAMEELKIPLTINDAAQGIVGNATLKLTYSFAGFPMARLQNCGIGAMGPNASSYRLHIAIVAFVDDAGASRSKLRVAFAAGATDLAGTSKEPTMCRSSGALEEKIAELVKQRLRTM